MSSVYVELGYSYSVAFRIVREHMVFDTDRGTGQVHHSAVSFPGWAVRVLIVSRVGKTYRVADWRVGHVAGCLDSGVS